MPHTILNPYENLTGGQWLKGNLHTHTTRSDGRRPMQQVIDDYASRGYHFLMISDHDLLTTPQDYASCNPRNLILIPGNEISKRGVHMLHVNASSLVPPDEDRQKVIDAINADSGFCIINHPDWLAHFNHCTIEQMRHWNNYTGIEIFNGSIGRDPGSAYSVDKWDMILSEGRRVWGFANDDHHLVEGDIENGWNMVYVANPTLENVIASLRAGRFYASTGVIIHDIRLNGRLLSITTANAQRILAIRQDGRRFAISDAPTLQAEIPDEASYVRIECWGAAEQFAWTQPIFLSRD